MNKNEWFLDTFAAIMSVSQDSDDVETLAESSIGRPIDTDQSSMKLMSSECSANPELLEYCQKFCAVNNCSYSKGLYKLMIPIADILAVDAARTISIFSALYQYRKKFTVPIIFDEEKNFGSKWSQWYWSGAWSSSSSIGSKTNLSLMVEFLCAFIRYHRPGVAYLLETFFGPDMGYKQYWSNWLSDSFVSVSESLGFARELMSTIASSGEPLTCVLMTVVILEEIIVRTMAKDDLADAISNFRLGYENLSSIWSTASEMASHTPRMFSQDFSRLLRRDEKRMNSVVAEFSVLGLSLEYIVRDLLDTQEQEKELETSPVGSSPGVLHSVIADEDFGGGKKNLPPLRCIAGASISQHLWVYSNNSVIGSPIVSSRGDPDDSPTVYIDARSEEERNSDNKTVIAVPIAVYNRPVPLSPRNLTTTSKPNKPDHELGSPSRERDWFADDEDGEEEADPPPPSVPTGPSEKFILYRFRPFVWMDVDEDELDTDDTTSASYAFMKKLEFFRNYRLCVIGGKKGIVAKKLIASLLRREFPYITGVRRKRRQGMSKSGFGMIRDEIANFTTVDVLEKIAIVSEIGELRPPPSPPSPPSPTTPPETRGMYSVSSSGSRFLANVKKQMSTNRFGKLMRPPTSSFRKRSSAQPVVPTLVLAPTPVEDPRPVPELDFEIGSSSNEEEEEIDFPSNSNDIRHV